MDENPNTFSPDDGRDEWKPCPAGTVTSLIGQLKHRRRMRRVKAAAALVGCLLLLAVAGRSLFTNEPPPGPLSHYDVVQLQDDYIQGKLSEKTTRLVEAHIDVCSQCAHLREDRRAFQEQQRSQTLHQQPDESKLLANAH